MTIIVMNRDGQEYTFTDVEFYNMHYKHGYLELRKPGVVQYLAHDMIFSITEYEGVG